MEEAFLKAIEINEDISFLKSPKSEPVETRFLSEGESRIRQELRRLESENKELKSAVLNISQKLEKEREITRANKRSEEYSSDLVSELQLLKAQKSQLEEKVKTLESEKSSQSKDLEEVWKKKMMQCEMRLTERNEQFNKEKEEIQRRCEETINHLKDMFESDKEKYLEKLLEAKDKHKREIHEVCEEFEKKLSEDRAASEEIIKQLKGEIEEKGREWNKKVEEEMMCRSKGGDDEEEISRKKMYEEQETSLMRKIEELSIALNEKDIELAKARRKTKKLREKNALMSEKVNDLLLR
jgi:hypothetical protein